MRNLENDSSSVAPLSSELSRFDYTMLGDSLERFAQVSGLTISVYDCFGNPKIDRIYGQSLAKEMFTNSRSACEKLENFEKKLVETSCRDARDVELRFNGSLPVNAYILEGNGKRFGVVVAGWAYDGFADPITCKSIANSLAIPEVSLWQKARENPPIGGNRLTSLKTLLKAWISSLVAQAVALESEKRSAQLKDQFLATASHELRTPITSIMLRAQTALKFSGSEPASLKSFESILRSAKALAKLVDDMLETSRLLTGKLRLELSEYSPLSLVNEAMDTLLPSATVKNIAIKLCSANELPLQVGDPMRLQQVVYNILNNAVKFTGDGGLISVSLVALNSGYILRVRDSGKGMSPDELRSLFKPFYQAEFNKNYLNPGLGLGLSITKSIVELHDGTITAKSEGAGLGTEFEIVMPSLARSEKLA